MKRILLILTILLFPIITYADQIYEVKEEKYSYVNDWDTSINFLVPDFLINNYHNNDKEYVSYSHGYLLCDNYCGSYGRFEYKSYDGKIIFEYEGNFSEEHETETNVFLETYADLNRTHLIHIFNKESGEFEKTVDVKEFLDSNSNIAYTEFYEDGIIILKAYGLRYYIYDNGEWIVQNSLPYNAVGPSGYLNRFLFHDSIEKDLYYDYNLSNYVSIYKNSSDVPSRYPIFRNMDYYLIQIRDNNTYKLLGFDKRTKQIVLEIASESIILSSIDGDYIKLNNDEKNDSFR